MAEKTTTASRRSSKAPAQSKGRSASKTVAKKAKSAVVEGRLPTKKAGMLLGPLRRTLDLGSAKPLKQKRQAPLTIVAVHPPIHPGEILREEFMAEMALTAYAIAKACKMNRSKVERIVREELGVSGDTAVRFGRYFGNSPQFWMNLQAAYEVQKASRDLGQDVERIEPLKYEAA